MKIPGVPGEMSHTTVECSLTLKAHPAVLKINKRKADESSVETSFIRFGYMFRFE